MSRPLRIEFPDATLIDQVDAFALLVSEIEGHVLFAGHHFTAAGKSLELFFVKLGEKSGVLDIIPESTLPLAFSTLF